MNGDGSCRAYWFRVVVGYWLFMTFCDYIYNIRIYILLYSPWLWFPRQKAAMWYGTMIWATMKQSTLLSAADPQNPPSAHPAWAHLQMMEVEARYYYILLLTTMLYMAISCWDMLRLLSIGFSVLSSGDCSEHLEAGNETCAEAWGQGAVALLKAT